MGSRIDVVIVSWHGSGRGSMILLMLSLLKDGSG